MAWWYAPDVSAWRVAQAETRGLRAKVWVVDETGQPWLRKDHRVSRPYEPTIEALTLELAARCGFEVAYGRACTWLDASGVTARGFVSRRFHDGTESQHTGGELVQSVLNVPFDTSSEKEAGRPHVTIDVVLGVLEEHARRHDADLLHPFLRMLAFDAWIGNGDRHSGNWALLSRGSSRRLAPMYDTAGSLGAELQDATVMKKLAQGEAAIAQYVRGCRSGFGDGVAVAGVLQQDLLARLRHRPEWTAIIGDFAAYVSNNLTMVGDVLADIPDGWLTAPRKELARALLVARAKMLEENV